MVSLNLPRRPPRPRAAAAVAAAALVAVALAAAPGAADQVRDGEWWLSEAHVTTAWQVSRGADVTVAVLDTGVNPDQPDLAGYVTSGPDYTGSARHPGDSYWGVHGTAMAVLIAGHGHGSGHADGIIGVAPKAKILSVRVTLEEPDPLRADTAMAAKLPAAIAAGIRYAANHGAKVIDLPLDPGAAYADGNPGAAAAAGGASAERNAVAYALSKAVVLVAPAGDDGPGIGQVNYPAAYPGVISVGAFDKTFAKSQFSSRRSYVTLTAPGDGILTATPGTGYTLLSTTTAASAEVAGMAALIRSRYPALTPRQVGQALTEGTRYRPAGGRRNGSGYGTADAVGALTAAAKIQAAAHPKSPATPSSAPPRRGQVTTHRGATVLRDALIGGAGLLLLLSLSLAVRMSRRRKQTFTGPRHRPPPRPRADVASNAAQAAGQWYTSVGDAQLPELGSVPKLPAGATDPTQEQPWEWASKSEREQPWHLLESAANGGRALGHSETDANGRDDAVRLADPDPLGPPVQRDPKTQTAGSGPLGGWFEPTSPDASRPYSAAGPYGAGGPPSAAGSPELSAAIEAAETARPAGRPSRSSTGGRHKAGKPPRGASPPIPPAGSRHAQAAASPPRSLAPEDPPATSAPVSALVPPPAAVAEPTARPPAQPTARPSTQPPARPPAQPPARRSAQPTARPLIEPSASPPVIEPSARPPATPAGSAQAGPPRSEAGLVPPQAHGAHPSAPTGRAWNPGAKTEDFRAVSTGTPSAAQDERTWSAPLPGHTGRGTTPPQAGYAERAPRAAPPGAETQAFPVIPLPDAAPYDDEDEDDEDDRHL